MMNYHLIDSVTLMRAIELLDRYSWILTSDNNATGDDKATLALTLRSLRNATKRDIDCTKKPVS